MRLKKVDVAEAPQLKNFGSKIKGKSFPFSLPHGLKLQKPINPMATVLEPGHVPDPRNSRLKIQFLPATATFLKVIPVNLRVQGQHEIERFLSL